MAAEPILAQNLDIKNTSAEPKKKLKKKRSIRVSRASNLRASSRRFKSRLSWEPFDLGSDDDDNDYDSSLHQSSSVASSDSLPNHIKSSASFVPSRGSHQGGSECDDGNSVVSSSSGSTEWIVQPSAVSVSDDGSVVQNSYSTEVSDASLDHPKAQNFSDGRKASNMRNAKVLIKKVSFKPKRATCKCGHMNEESNLEKATCSSIIKDARFPDRVELQPGEAESERISFAKVCRYHHCSLNGHHSHDPPLVKKFSFLRRKSGKPQMNAKSNNIASRPRTKSSVDMKDLKKPDINPSVGSSADEDTVEKNKQSKDFKKADKNSKGLDELEVLAKGSFENEKKGHESFDEHPNLNSKSSENMAADIARKSSSEKVDESRKDLNVMYSLASEAPRLNVNEKESKYNQKLDENLTESTLGGEKETTSSLKLQKPQFNGGKSMSLWNLIHKQMVSSLTEEDATNARKRIQGAEEEKKVKETKEDISNESFVSYPSESDVGINHMEEGNQETEIQKLFAIKMVREAIEKILLPELQDQSSETQSITSESTEDHQLPKDNHQEDPAEDKYNFDTKSSERISNDSIGDTAKNTSETKRVKSEKKSPSNWSNLKKWILLQRFVKAMEKVRKFKPRQPHHLPLESDPDAEKVDLRRQTVSERKRSEEWMLDYAIRQVVSELAPTQKRKVALLVKAFETIVPTQEDTQVSWPHIKGERHESIRVTSQGDLVEDMKPQASEDVPFIEESKRELDSQDLSSASTENLVNDSEPFPDVEKRDVSPHAIKSTVREMDLKVTVTVKIQPEPVNNVPEDTISVSKLLHNMDIRLENAPFDPKEEVVVYNQGRPTKSEIPIESVLKGNEKAQIQLDKENYMIMWHMIYQHVAANVATKVGNHFLEGGDNVSSDIQTSGSQGDSTERSNDAATEVSDQESDFSRSDAVKLIQEAVDEILLPEIPDDTSDTQSVSSEATLDQDPYETERGEFVNENIANTSVLNEEYVKEIERSNSVVSVEETKPTPPKLNSWRKLKKLMLLKRSIKAMEKARKLKSLFPRQNLPVPSEAEPEKIDLRRQMVNERKKAEQWMLDYAVQNIVTELTPARKRRVAMLVEAFEAVVPLPEI